VESPLTLPAGAPAAAADVYLSRDRRAALFDITPANGLPLKQIGQLARDLSGVVPSGPFSVQIGGTPADHNDFDDAMFRSLPRIFGFVIGATLVLLFIAFRSYLLPVKAVIMNLLAVAAGIGAVVAVFQLGWLDGLIGLERPFAAIPLEVPMMVFCLSFGLSMDYELFLLFSIQRQYARDGNNNRATVDGLVAVAPVITGAGLIMAVVFGAFAGAQLPVLKMMGVGLCVSVLVDATVIRALLVPAGTGTRGGAEGGPGRAWLGLVGPWEAPRRASSGHGFAATREHAAQVADGREDFVVPVGALGVVGALFVFDDVLVLAEDVFREPGDEGPDHVDDSRNRGLLDR
jgi:uncharacterized membrane protein YdfJ with MMPL/SSD domain